MSVYIRIERYSCPPQIVQLRGWMFCAGWDNQGFLTFESPHTPFFVLSRSSSHTFFHSCQDHIIFDEISLPTGQSKPLKLGSVARWEDMQFTFFEASTISEILAYSKEPISSEKIFEGITSFSPITIRIRLANTDQYYPFFPHIHYTVGSDEKDIIFIPIADVHPSHLSLFLDQTLEYATVTPTNGEVQSLLQSLPASLPLPIQLRLLPSQILLEVTSQPC